MPQPGCVSEAACESSVSSEWARMPLSSAASVQAVFEEDSVSNLFHGKNEP